jgi:hypothetical protein
MTISLIYAYIQYDVEQLAERYADAWTPDPEMRFKLTLRSDEGDEADLMRRLIDTACSRLGASLQKYLQNNPADADDSLRNDKKRDYRLRDTKADGQAVADLMHWCAVRYAIAEWCRMQGKYGEADAEAAEAATMTASLTESLRRGSMPMKEGKAQKVEEDKIFVHYGKEG